MPFGLVDACALAVCERRDGGAIDCRVDVEEAEETPRDAPFEGLAMEGRGRAAEAEAAEDIEGLEA